MWSPLFVCFCVPVPVLLRLCVHHMRKACPGRPNEQRPHPWTLEQRGLACVCVCVRAYIPYGTGPRETEHASSTADQTKQTKQTKDCTRMHCGFRGRSRCYSSTVTQRAGSARARSGAAHTMRPALPSLGGAKLQLVVCVTWAWTAAGAPVGQFSADAQIASSPAVVDVGNIQLV